jgi:hypothetical protein
MNLTVILNYIVFKIHNLQESYHSTVYLDAFWKVWKEIKHSARGQVHASQIHNKCLILSHHWLTN